MKIDSSRSHLLGALIVLTVLIVFAQLVFMLADIFVFVGFDNVTSNPLLATIFSAPAVIRSLVFYVVVQGVLGGLFVASIWYVALAISDLVQLSLRQRDLVGIGLWFICVCAVIVANMLWFPRAFFSRLAQEYLLHEPMPASQLSHVLWVLGAILAVAISCAVWQCLSALLKRQQLRRHGICLVMSLIIGVAWVDQHSKVTPDSWHSATAAKPNIILIGIDALRPDFVTRQQNQTILMPALQQFLTSATVFENAYTPIAQTFPAWISLLTSVEPKQNSIRENLMNPSGLMTENMLPSQLQKMGYETRFATDDLRFNTMQQAFGFDQVIGPATGATDFILGAFNDFPLSNLLIPTTLGHWLFPYNFGNHEAIATYEAHDFMQLLQISLRQATNKPLFLAVHFNVSGWPFGVASSPLHQSGAWLSWYQDALPIVDKQFADFLALLHSTNVLQHAIVVVLSDHGVTLGLPGDRLVTESLYQGDKRNLDRLARTRYSESPASLQRHNEHGMDTSYGYGGDVLSQKQYHVALAFKRYDINWQTATARLPARVSLLDVAPTLWDVLQQPPLSAFHGVSLLPLLEGKQAVLPTRPFFFESYRNAVEAETNASVVEFVRAGLEVCEFNATTGQLYKMPNVLALLAHDKARAVVQDDWLLAEVPGLTKRRTWEKRFLQSQPNGTKKSVMVEGHVEVYNEPPFYVLLNLKNGRWTTELNHHWTRQAPVTALCNQLSQFYGNELACRSCCRGA